MLASEIIAEDRRANYDEHSRILLARLMSERGGMLMKDLSPEEIEAKQVEFFKQMMILDTKFIDVIRDNWGLDPNDETATFGDDLDSRWDHFIRNHVVTNKGKDTILYRDKDGAFRLIPGKSPDIDGLEFVMENFDKIVIEEDIDTLEKMPSVTVMGIEGIGSKKYENFNKDYKEKDFFVTQMMIIAAETLDIIAKHKDELKDNELFNIIKEKSKDIFN